MADVLLLAVAIPVLAALLIMTLSAKATEMIRAIGLLGALIPAAFVIAAYVAFNHGAAGATALQYPFSVRWLSVANAFNMLTLHIQFAFGVDGVSMPLVVLVGIVSTLSCVRSFRVVERVKSHYVWMLFLTMGLYGV
ncbi:MAG: hypothetical protein ACYCVB_16550, partial [Bacilli bacterium]